MMTLTNITVSRYMKDNVQSITAACGKTSLQRRRQQSCYDGTKAIVFFFGISLCFAIIGGKSSECVKKPVFFPRLEKKTAFPGE